MSQIEVSILESWPALKEDLGHFLSDTDAWAISQLKKAYEDRDWTRVLSLLDIMELLHGISHSH